VQRDQAVQVEPAGQWDSGTEFRDGYYRRAAIAWTRDGRHMFLVVHHHPRSVLETRDLFALYRGKKYVGPGPILSKLHDAYKALPQHERPCPESDLPQQIENAMLLDGGHSATLMYRCYVGVNSNNRPLWEDRGSWVTGKMWRPDQPPVPTMIEIVER